MDKINGRGRADFRWRLFPAIICLAASVWPCYAQDSRSPSPQRMELVHRLMQLQQEITKAKQAGATETEQAARKEQEAVLRALEAAAQEQHRQHLLDCPACR